MGTDFHGQNVTKAAVKAVKDAISHSCLCGLSEVLALKDLDRDIKITVTVAVSRPEEVNPETVAACLPIKRTLSPSAISVRRIFLRSIRGSEHDTAGFSAGHRGIQQRFLADGGEIPAVFKSARVVLLNECQSFF